ncbi:MAG: extracellular solute-binding protein [Treponema sp.]|jgi:ABC-type glycerol-3-phosphate transport system substrate-binding protein|nr:extracellular solute-binding protein [Treponema sp.]
MLKRTIRFGLIFAGLALMAAAAWAGGSKDLLKGKDIVIGNWWSDWDVNTFKPTDEPGELMLEWRKKIQKDNGVTIREKQVAGWGEMMDSLVTSIMAGKPIAHAVTVMPEWAMSMYKMGLLAPLSDSKAVDLKTTTAIPYRQVQYNQNIGSAFTFNGKQYALFIGNGNSDGVYFNKRLFREAGLDPDLPYNMQKDGTWTWDNFFNLSKRLTRDRNNTGRIDTWALPADNAGTILSVMVVSNGAQFIARDASGKFVNATSRPEFLEALNFSRRLHSENIMMPKPEGSGWDWHTVAFVDGQVAMLIEAQWRAGAFKDSMNDDWGYVLPPKGPKAKNYLFPESSSVMVVPSVFRGTELDTILAAINLWNMPVTDDWKSGVWGLYRDRRAVDETLAMVRTPGYGVYMNEMLIPGLETGDIAWYMWWHEGEPAQLVESVSQNWNALIDEVNKTGR